MNESRPPAQKNSTAPGSPAVQKRAERLWQWISRRILGPGYETLDLEQKLFTWVMVLCALASLLAFVENIILHFHVLLQAGTIALGLLFTLLFVLVRRGISYRRLVYPAIISLIVFLAEVWFFNAGSHGGTEFYLLITALPIMVFMRGAGRAITMGIYLIMIISLFVLEQTNPGLIVGYSSESERFVDVAVSFFMTMILITSFVLVLHNGYQEAVKKVNAEKRASDARFFETADMLPVGICETDRDLTVSFLNRAGYDLTGLEQDDLDAQHSALNLFHPDDRTRAETDFASILSGNHVPLQEYRLVRKDKKTLRLLVQCDHVWAQNSVAGLRMCLIDITVQKLLEEQYRQSQKMESVGLLAGGVAHDFNNIMSAVFGYATLIKAQNATREKDAFGTRLDEQISAVLRASERATDLVRKLLAFSRQGSYEEKPVNMHALIDEVTTLLSHSIDKRITITKALTALNPVVSGDQALLQSALLNLAINARDAMPDGGTLTFSTRSVVFDKQSADPRALSVAPGSYVAVTVADTGVGLDDRAREHLYEPFFTTKEPGKGTGLGLASVFGTVKRHGGFIEAESEKGKGTAMAFYLPQAAAAAAVEGPAPQAAAPGRSLHVLIVDDESMICDFVKEFLVSEGHRATAFTNPQEAVEWYRKSFADVDCTVLDMNMPVMDGKACFAAMRKINPRAKALFSTGFMVGDTAAIIRMPGIRGYVQKPFSLDALMQSIVQAVDSEAA
jgi:two-component system, cell cycle sensor histidine kinase and response regulator CckA